MLTVNDFKSKQIIFVFTNEKQKLSFSNDNIIVKDAEERVIHQSTCYRIFCLFVIGEMSITTKLIQKAKKFGFSIVLMTSGFRVYEVLSSVAKGNYILRNKQYLEKFGVEISKHIVVNKLLNQINLLKDIRVKNSSVKNNIELIQQYIEKIKILKNGDEKILLGFEGMSTRLYFQSFFQTFSWNGRKPRTKVDIPNLLLDIGYTYLFNLVEAFLQLYGFDLYKGFYHTCFWERKSLVCDIVEPFRCIIDSSLKKSYGLNQIHEEDFKFINHRWFLSPNKNKHYSGLFISRLLDYRDDFFIYVQEFYRCYMQQKNIAEYPVFNFIERRAKKC